MFPPLRYIATNILLCYRIFNLNFARIIRSLPAIFFALCLLTACQESAEESHSQLTPTKSHRSVKEKTVIVPPEVSRRWSAVRVVVLDKSRGIENIYSIPIGSAFKVPSSSLTIAVEAFLPAFIMQGTSITTSSNELLNPGVKVRITENATPIFEGWLFSKFPNTHAVTHPKYGFSLLGVVPVKK